MKILIKNATLQKKICNGLDGVFDLLIADGTIGLIRDSISEEADKIIDAGKSHLIPGCFDLHVNFCEPGFEEAEDFDTGCNSAAAGGVTGVLQMPGTKPVLQSKSGIELIRKRTNGKITSVFAAGAVSTDLQGEELAEMYDLHTHGVNCFTDHKKSIQHAGLLLRAMQYVSAFGGLIMQFADDKSISRNGQMNEGKSSTVLGLPGIPSLAEEIMIDRDLKIAEYLNSPIHFSTVSSAKAINSIRKAKEQGINVTCDTSAHHLMFDDSHLATFDSNFKIQPPLRSRQDIAELILGIKDGTIDAICSDHMPRTIEEKRKEFSLASNGIIGVQTLFSQAYSVLRNELSLDRIIELLSTAPRKIAGVEIPSFAEGAIANFCLVDLNAEWVLESSMLKSKSKNTPLIGSQLTSKIKSVFNNNLFEEFD